MKQEPAINTGTIGALVTAAIAILVAAGVPISAELKVAILGFVAVLAPIIVAFIIRHNVVPAAQVVEQADGAGNIVAGAASELSTGDHIRAAGSLLTADGVDLGAVDDLVEADVTEPDTLGVPQTIDGWDTETPTTDSTGARRYIDADGDGVPDER